MKYIKYIVSATSALVLLAGGVGTAWAAPFDSNNPNIVANYPTGDHGIVGEFSQHSGADVVMQAGNNGTFQQWFCGTGDTSLTECEHSVWQPSTDGTCPATWTLVPNPNPAWGSYLKPGVDYCVHNNDSNVH